MWMLRTEPGSFARAIMLLTAQPCVQPPVFSFLNLGLIYYYDGDVCICECKYAYENTMT